MKNISLKGERINLRTPTMKDVDAIGKHINDKQVVRFTENIPHPYTRKDGEFYVKNIAQKRLKQLTGYEFVICEKKRKEIIGGICLANVNKKHDHAEIGYWIGRKFWRQGYGSEALKILLDFAFRTLKLHKVYGQADEPNEASIKLMAKLGFKKEGTFREHVKHGKKRHNTVQLSLLRSEYDKKN